MRRLLVVLIVALASPALAQPLTDRVPADALFYIGWRGTDALGPAYENSHLAAIVNASNIGQIFDQTLPSIFNKFAEDKPEELAQVQAALPLFKHLWKRPTAVYFAPGLDARGRFDGQLAILCDAGDVAKDFHKSLSALAEQGAKRSPPVKTAIDGPIVMLCVGYDDAMTALKPKSALRSAPAFTSAMKQADAEPVYTAFFDFERIVGVLDQQIAADNKPQDLKEWRGMRDALGLPGLKRMVMTGAFAGKDWSSKMFIEAPAPRRGLLALLDDVPVRESTLKLIPKSASYAMVRQFDLGKLLARLREGIAPADKDAVKTFDKGLAKASAAAGTDIRQLLDALGDQWVIYNDAGVGGAGSEGVVIVNELDDPAKAEAGISALVATAVRMAGGAPNAPFAVTAGDVELGDNLKVHTINLPQGRPSWMVKNGKLYIAFKPEAVGAATLVGTSAVAGGNIFDNEKFKALRQQLGTNRMSGFEFADLPQTAQIAHANMLKGLAVLGMLGASQGIWVPPNLLPPLNVLQQHLAPAANVTFVDATGWHSRGVSPFPGSKLFASQQFDMVAVGGSALAVSIALPSLNRARETANRVKCASNMRQMGQAILLYSNDNRGKYPDKFGDLLRTQDITIEVFTCPSGNIDPPEDVVAGGMEKMARWIDAGKSPYVYLGKGLRNNADQNTLVLYEREDDHDGDGMNMLFADGSVEWFRMAEAKQVIANKKRPRPARDLKN